MMSYQPRLKVHQHEDPRFLGVLPKGHHRRVPDDAEQLAAELQARGHPAGALLRRHLEHVRWLSCPCPVSRTGSFEFVGRVFR